MTVADREGGDRRVSGVLEVATISLMYVAYSIGRHLATSGRGPAVRRAGEIEKLERFLHLGWENGAVRLAVSHPVLGLLAAYWYSAAHYLVTPVVLVWLFRTRPDVYRRARNALLIGTSLGLVLYLLLPTAPPRLVGFPDILAAHAARGWWGADASAPRGLGGWTNQLAAFPSLHAGWALWVALTWGTNAGHLRRTAGVTYAAATAVVVVMTANHWILDVIVGWAVVLIGWLVTARRDVHAG